VNSSGERSSDEREREFRNERAQMKRERWRERGREVQERADERGCENAE